MRNILIVALVLMTVSFTLSAGNVQLTRITAIAAGTAQIDNGEAVVLLDINIEGYTVSLTPIGSAGQVYVYEKSPNSFTVKSDQSDLKFDYVVYADWEAVREHLTSGKKDQLPATASQAVIPEWIENMDTAIEELPKKPEREDKTLRAKDVPSRAIEPDKQRHQQKPPTTTGE